MYLNDFFRAPAWACQCCREQQIGASQTALRERHRSVIVILTYSSSAPLDTMRSSQVQPSISSLAQGTLPSNQKHLLSHHSTRDGRPLPGRQTH